MHLPAFVIPDPVPVKILPVFPAPSVSGSFLVVLSLSPVLFRHSVVMIRKRFSPFANRLTGNDIARGECLHPVNVSPPDILMNQILGSAKFFSSQPPVFPMLSRMHSGALHPVRSGRTRLLSAFC